MTTMTIFFITVLVLSIFYKVSMGSMLTITKGGLLAGFFYKALPILLSFCECLLVLKLAQITF